VGFLLELANRHVEVQKLCDNPIEELNKCVRGMDFEDSNSGNSGNASTDPTGGGAKAGLSNSEAAGASSNLRAKII
jgi:hypothetical protein